MSDIVVIPACDFVEPLKILIIRQFLVDPQKRLLRCEVIVERITFHLDMALEH